MSTADTPLVGSLLGRPARATMAAAWLSMVLLAAGLQARAQGEPAIANAESSAPAPATALQGPQLLAALKRGGYVVYFRHTATDFSRGDAGMKGYDDCDNQRPLSAQGKLDATRIGLRIRALGLVVSEAFASPYCRTMEHARLMLTEVKPRAEIREAQAGDHAGLKRLLTTPVPPGGNRWIVGHGNPFRAVAGPPHLGEGEAAVIRPGTTRWTVVARLGVADWQTLGAAP